MNKIKLLIATGSCFVGGDENVIVRIATRLDKQDFDVHLGIEIGKSNILTDRLDEHSIPWYEICVEGEDNHSTKRIEKWEEFLKKLKPHIILTSSFIRSFVVPGALKHGIPLIERGGGISGQTKFYFDKIICEYAGYKNKLSTELLSLGLKDNTELIFNGIDFNEFKPTPKNDARQILGIRKEAYIIGMAARTHPVKNLELPIKAVHELSKNIDIELHIVGQCFQTYEQEYKLQLLELINNLGCTNVIKFYAPTDNVPLYYSAFDIVSLTSKSEGAPNAILEAVVMKKPIVATDVGGIRELTGGQAFYTKDDVEDAVQKYKQCLEAPEEIEYYTRNRHNINIYIQEMERQLKQTYKRYYDEDNTRNRIAFIFDSLYVDDTIKTAISKMIEKYEVFIFAISGDKNLFPGCRVKVLETVKEFSDAIINKWIHEYNIKVSIDVNYNLPGYNRKVIKLSQLDSYEIETSECSKPISVVIPIHRTIFLDKAIESLNNQTFKDFDVIAVVDKCNESVEILKILNNTNYKVISSDIELGPAGAINLAAQNCRTEFMVRLDSDDIMEPNALEVLNEYINIYPEIGYFYSGRRIINGDKVIDWPLVEFSPVRLEGWFIACHMIAWRMKEFDACGGFDQNIKYASDYDFALKMALSGCKFKAIPHILYSYRIHDTMYTNGFIDKEKLIADIRSKYVERKSKLGISWIGESSNVIAPRKMP